MAKKSIKTIKKQKNIELTSEINQSHSCIVKDQWQLEKLYKKAIVATNKNRLTTKKLLAKAKKQVIKAKRHKKRAPKVYQTALSELESLQQQMKFMKGEFASLEMAYMKFNAQQKALLKFEKEWAKKTDAPKKKRIKKRKIKTGRSTTQDVFHEVATVGHNLT